MVWWPTADGTPPHREIIQGLILRVWGLGIIGVWYKKALTHFLVTPMGMTEFKSIRSTTIVDPKNRNDVSPDSDTQSTYLSTIEHKEVEDCMKMLDEEF